MKIYVYIARTDLPTYQKIIKIYGFNPNKTEGKKAEKRKSDIKLGDSVTNLMKHNAYKRIGRRIKQTRWE